MPDTRLCLYQLAGVPRACRWRVDEEPEPAVAVFDLDEDLDVLRRVSRVPRGARYLGVHPGDTWVDRALHRALTLAHGGGDVEIWRVDADPREVRHALRAAGLRLPARAVAASR